MRNFFIIPLIFISILLSACGSAVPKMKPFKMEIQQGNVVTSKMLLQLRPGMTKSQVKFIMGTPLIVDSFHSNRWDYFYQMRQSGKVTEQRRVILDFEKELLARVRGDVVPQGTPGAEPAQDGNKLPLLNRSTQRQ
jgi:outer membrane protein assembly factor BamE